MRPTEYERSYSFAGWQANNPQKPLPGQKLDNELENISRTTGETINQLSLIQRADGALRNGIVTNEALAPGLQTGVNPAEPWIAAKSYAPGDTVFAYVAFYRCMVGHVSSDFDADLLAGYWMKIADFEPIVAGAIEAREDAEAAAMAAQEDAATVAAAVVVAEAAAGAATAAAAQTTLDAAATAADRVQTGLDAAAAAESAALAASNTRFVDDVLSLSGLPGPLAVPHAFMPSTVQKGQFEFRSGDYAAAVADDGQFLTIASDVVAPALGAWIKVVKQGDISARDDLGLTGDIGVDGDVTEKFQWALLRGRLLLERGAEYSISERLEPLDGGGILTRGGGVGLDPLIEMTRAGFTASDYSNPFYAANACGIFAEGKKGVVLRDFRITLGAGAGFNTSLPIAMSACERSAIENVEAFGFQEMQRAAIFLNSLIDCRVVGNYVHDCTSNNNALPFVQITGIGADSDRVGGVFSENLIIERNRISRLTLGAAAQVAFPWQTDGMQLGNSTSGTGSRIIVRRNLIEDVYEGIDFMGAEGLIEANKIRRVLIGVKLVNGASHNKVLNNDISMTTGPGIGIFGSNTTTEPSQYNDIVGNHGRSIGDHPGTTPFAKSFIVTDGNGTVKPDKNFFADNHALGAAMTHLVLIGAGAGNIVETSNTALSAPTVTRFADSSGFVNYLPEGTWTPVVSNTANVASSTPSAASYERNGRRVTCFGTIAVTPTAAGGVELDITLPVTPANFTVAADATGYAGSASIAGTANARAGSPRVQLSFTAPSTTAVTLRFHFTYRI